MFSPDTPQNVQRSKELQKPSFGVLPSDEKKGPALRYNYQSSGDDPVDQNYSQLKKILSLDTRPGGLGALMSQHAGDTLITLQPNLKQTSNDVSGLGRSVSTGMVSILLDADVRKDVARFTSLVVAQMEHLQLHSWRPTGIENHSAGDTLKAASESLQFIGRKLVTSTSADERKLGAALLATPEARGIYSNK